MSHKSSILSHPFSTTWRKALVSLPRLVPDHALYVTSPDGPQPFVVKIPSFHPKNHDIPCYVFLYVPPKGTPTIHKSASSNKLGLTATQVSVLSTASTASSITTHSGTEINTLSLPVLLDFHGGSFILGTPQEQAPFCSQMARELGASASGGGCIVISVDYRLGPYATYPAANEDAEDVLRAIMNGTTTPGKVLRESVRSHLSKLGRDEWCNIDTNRVAISGFSSGGNMALGLAMSIKNDPTIHRDWPSQLPMSCTKDIPLLLFYPSLDSRLLPDERPRPPGLDPPSGFFTRLKIESELMPKYMPVEKRGHPRASPGLADLDGLHKSAKIMLILPELDSLSQQSMEWIQKVRDYGRGDDLEVLSVPGVMHGWTQFPDGWIKDESEKAKKYMVFAAAREFVKRIWEEGGEDRELTRKITRDEVGPKEAEEVLREQERVDKVLGEAGLEAQAQARAEGAKGKDA